MSVLKLKHIVVKNCSDELFIKCFTVGCDICRFITKDVIGK